MEQIILDSERPLSMIAGTIDIVPRFSDGYGQTTNTIIQRFEGLQTDNEALSQALTERDRAVEELEGQIADLEEQLGGASEEHQALRRRMEAEAAVRKRFDRIQKMFSTDEARVLREGDNVIVRVVGLQFDSGKAVIKPEYFALLTKVQDAINLFPGSVLEVEGHTDSYGTDEMNLKLSEDRASAVREYLLANMRIDEERVTAVGRGESEPVANNETAEGRARNRRIDIVITPNMDALVE
jgi:OmpA-OmpF porin, OOP family